MMPANGEVAPDDVIDVVHARAAHRFEISVNGEAVGFAAYIDDGARRIFHHTVVEDRFTGRGLAARLVAGALAETVAEGLRIVPVCSYVARYLATHHEVDDALDRVTADAIAAVRGPDER